MVPGTGQAGSAIWMVPWAWTVSMWGWAVALWSSITHVDRSTQILWPRFHEIGLPEWCWHTDFWRFSKVTEVMVPILYLLCHTQLSPPPLLASRWVALLPPQALHGSQSSMVGWTHLLQELWKSKLLVHNSNKPFLHLLLPATNLMASCSLVLSSDRWRLNIPWENGTGIKSQKWNLTWKENKLSFILSCIIWVRLAFAVIINEVE